MARTVAPRSLELDAHELLSQELDSIERDRRAQDVAAKVFEPLALVLVDGHLGVEIEAIDAGLASRRQEHETALLVRRVFGSGGGNGAGLTRGGMVLREGELLVVERIVVLAPIEPCPNTFHDAREHGLDFGRARG